MAALAGAVNSNEAAAADRADVYNILERHRRDRGRFEETESTETSDVASSFLLWHRYYSVKAVLYDLSPQSRLPTPVMQGCHMGNLAIALKLSIDVRNSDVLMMLEMLNSGQNGGKYPRRLEVCRHRAVCHSWRAA